MRRGTQFIIVIDGYGGAGRLVVEAHTKGYKCVHIQSSPKLSMEDRATFFPRAYVANMTYDDNFEEIVKVLRRIKPSGVVAGSKSGVPLAEKLGEALKVPNSGTELTQLLRAN